MFTTIRKHQRWLMLVIAVLTIVAFAFLYNTTDLDRVGSNIVAKIYGRDVMQVDIERAVRNYQLSLALGQFELVRDLSGQAQSEDQAVNNFIWNLMVLQHEAGALGVEPGTQAVVDRIKTVPAFQTDGKFDPSKYAAFVQEQLAPRGFNESQLESVIRDSLRLEGIKALVESPAVVLADEIMPALLRSAPVDVEVLRFDATTAAKDVAVSDEELQKAFEERKASLVFPEKRSVRYVAFALPAEAKDLKEKARVDAMQKIATATGDFAQVVGDSGRPLAEVAKEKGFEVRTTPLFAPDASTGGALTGLDGEAVPAAAAVAFRLAAAPGNFEIVALGDEGYAVIEVAEVQAARPQTFEEARADLRAELITGKREQLVREQADKTVAAIRERLAAGKSLADAAKELKLKTEAMTGLSVFSEDLTPEQRQITITAMDLEPGKLGEFVPTATGGFATYLVSRAAPDAEAVQKRKATIEEGILQRKQMLLFVQWLTSAREAAKLQALRPMM